MEYYNMVNKDSIALAMKNSGNKDKLTEFLESFDVSYSPLGKAKYFADDKNERLVLNIKIAKKEEDALIYFEFGMSIHDTEIWYAPSPGAEAAKLKEVKRGILYSILCSIGLDYNIPDTFKEFCSEYGYSDDSIKALATYKECLAQSDKLQGLIPENLIEGMPS